MAMDLGGAQGGLKNDINVTPLVDVMLVLLVIMMLVAPLLQQGVPLTLPLADNYADKPETQEQTVVSIAANKAVYLNARFIETNDLGNRVEESLRGSLDKIVLIKADEAVDYSTVMTVMDQLRAAQIENIALITERKTPGTGFLGGN